MAAAGRRTSTPGSKLPWRSTSSISSDSIDFQPDRNVVRSMPGARIEITTPRCTGLACAASSLESTRTNGTPRGRRPCQSGPSSLNIRSSDVIGEKKSGEVVRGDQGDSGQGRRLRSGDSGKASHADRCGLVAHTNHRRRARRAVVASRSGRTMLSGAPMKVLASASGKGAFISFRRGLANASARMPQPVPKSSHHSSSSAPHSVPPSLAREVPDSRGLYRRDYVSRGCSPRSSRGAGHPRSEGLRRLSSCGAHRTNRGPALE